MGKKKTAEQFKQEVFNLVGDEYTVLGEYEDAQTKILMCHNKCGHEWMVQPGNFKNGTRCPKCAENRKRTLEEFKAEVFDLVGDEYTVLGEYKNTVTPILMRHNTCGHEWYVCPGNFKQGGRCPKCHKSGKKAETTENFKAEVKKLVGDEYTVLGEHKNTVTPILMRHNTCGHEWFVQPSNFKHGSRCPNCYGTKKSTTEEFKQEVFNLAGDEYSVLGEYVNTNTPIKMQHNTCGNVWKIRPVSFKSGTRCPKCAGNMKITTEQFRQEVLDLAGDEYSVLGEYVNANTPIKMRHDTCGHEWMVIPANFKRGTRCPECFGHTRKTTEQFRQEVFNLTGDEYSVLGKYVNANTPILMKHNTCGHEWPVRPNSFKRGTRCPECANNRKRATVEEFKQDVFNLVGDEYTVLGEYKNSDTAILMRHNICGHEWPVQPGNFKNGTRCPKCAGNIKSTTEQFRQEVFNLVGDEYTVLGEYKNSVTPILMRHNTCGHEWSVRPGLFKHGTRCPICNKGGRKKKPQTAI